LRKASMLEPRPEMRIEIRFSGLELKK